MTYDYLAESTGLAIGRRQGYADGHAAGYVDGNNDAVARWNRQVDEKWAPLVDCLTAERDAAIRDRDAAREEVRQLGQQASRWRTGFYSLLCALDSALDALQAAPQSLRTRMIVDLGKRTEYMYDKGWIDSMPYDNAIIRQLAPKTGDQLKGWWQQVITRAKQDTERDQSPTP
jgi:hypothetical protein